jgi:hypothetical protein
MNRLARILTAAGLLLLAALGGPGRAAGAAIDNLQRYFAGNYTGVTPGNHLLLQINPVNFAFAQEYDYFLTISGTFEKTNIRQQGLIKIQAQGDSIYLGYIPHFDPAITGVSPGINRFNSDELDSACGTYLYIVGDGFGGQTRPSDCIRAIRGAAGRSWNVEIEPNRITLKDAKTGETLRFEKETKQESKPETKQK